MFLPGRVTRHNAFFVISFQISLDFVVVFPHSHCCTFCLFSVSSYSETFACCMVSCSLAGVLLFFCSFLYCFRAYYPICFVQISSVNTIINTLRGLSNYTFNVHSVNRPVDVVRGYWCISRHCASILWQYNPPQISLFMHWCRRESVKQVLSAHV
jgi:hypothetical protein